MAKKGAPSLPEALQSGTKSSAASRRGTKRRHSALCHPLPRVAPLSRRGSTEKVSAGVTTRQGRDEPDFRSARTSMHSPYLPPAETYAGCACPPSGCSATTCPCRQPSGFRECGPHCGCSRGCGNRVSQRGEQLIDELEAFRTDNKGWGVRCNTDIAAGECVVEFAAEIITRQEYSERVAAYDERGLNYTMQCIEKFPERKGQKERKGRPLRVLRHYFDATCHGNIARFINHSCDPNLEPRPVRIYSSVPRIYFFARRGICSGEELSFCYGGMKDVAAKRGVECQKSGPRGQTTTPEKVSSTRCLCGSKRCIGFLPSV